MVFVHAGGRPRRSPLPLAIRSSTTIACSMPSRSAFNSASILVISILTIIARVTSRVTFSDGLECGTAGLTRYALEQGIVRGAAERELLPLSISKIQVDQIGTPWPSERLRRSEAASAQWNPSQDHARHCGFVIIQVHRFVNEISCAERQRTAHVCFVV